MFLLGKLFSNERILLEMKIRCSKTIIRNILCESSQFVHLLPKGRSVYRPSPPILHYIGIVFVVFEIFFFPIIVTFFKMLDIRFISLKGKLGFFNFSTVIQSM